MEPRVNIKAKIRRLKGGKTLRALDLFSGCGGLSLGFHAGGFEIVGSVELDPLAAESHARNFQRKAPLGVQALHSKARDITRIDPEELAAELDLGTPFEEAVDVIIGGPPCQAFARVGRAKLRAVAAHPKAFQQDPRANLYLRFIHYVEAFQPLAVVMENVPDVVNFGGHNHRCEAATAAASADEIRDLVEDSFRQPERWERRLIPGAGLDRLDEDLIVSTAQQAREQRQLSLGNQVEPILTALNLFRDGTITNAAEVLFGRKPAQQFPQVRVRVTVYAADKGGDFVDNQEWHPAKPGQTRPE